MAISLKNTLGGGGHLKVVLAGTVQASTTPATITPTANQYVRFWLMESFSSTSGALVSVSIGGTVVATNVNRVWGVGTVGTDSPVNTGKVWDCGKGEQVVITRTSGTNIMNVVYQILEEDQ